MDRISADAFGLVKRVLSDHNEFWVTSMGLSATNMQATPEKTASITTFMRAKTKAGAEKWLEKSEERRGDTETAELSGRSNCSDAERVEKADGEAHAAAQGGIQTMIDSRRSTKEPQKKRPRWSPLQAWLAKGNGPRPTGASVEGQSEDLPSQRRESTAEPSEQVEGGHVKEEDLRSEALGLQDGAMLHLDVDGSVGRASIQSASQCVWEDGKVEEDVQLTLGEWIPQEERSNFIDEEACFARDAEGDAKVEDRRDPQAEAMLEDTNLPAEASARLIVEEGSCPLPAPSAARTHSEAADHRGTSETNLAHTAVALGTASRAPKRVEAPRSLEALWQKANVGRGENDRREEKIEMVAERSSAPPQSRKRTLDGRVLDNRETLHTLWSKAAPFRTESEPQLRGQSSEPDFDWQQVDQGILAELPDEIQAEIRSAQRLQVQRQQPRVVQKKSGRPQHAQNIQDMLSRRLAR